MAAKAREEQEILLQRIAELEDRVAQRGRGAPRRTETGEAPGPGA